MGSSEPSRPQLRLVSATEAGKPASVRPPALEVDDTELLTEVRRGDPGAATAFHDRVRPQVDRTVRRLLGAGDPDREDIAQLALIELVSTIDRYRGDCSLDAWTSTLTARVVYKAIRRRRTERRLFAGVAPADAETGVARQRAPETWTHDLLPRVLGHLRAIDESRAWAFLLHDVWGYDLREMADIMDVSVAAAQSRLVRGRRELHARIARDPELADTMTRFGGDA